MGVGTSQPKTVASGTLTFASLASLPTSSTLLAGAQSTALDTTNLINSGPCDELQIGGKIKAGTSPTGGFIEVWAYAAFNDTPFYPDTITGSDGTVTITSRDILNSGFTFLGSVPCSTTTGQVYPFGLWSMRQKFAGQVPAKLGLLVLQSSGVALDATTTNHAFYWKAWARQY
jgi:hypothetical protein